MTTKPTNGPKQTTATTTKRASPRAAFDRVLPHDDDAERALLGSMIQEKEAIGEAITVLRDVGAAAFDSPKHQRLYEVLVYFYTENQPIDGVVLRKELTPPWLVGGIGGLRVSGRLG